MKKISVLLVLIFLINRAESQEADSLGMVGNNKIKPIAQVFGTASYSLENERYEYGFGRTHLGLEYQFNDKWSSKIIIDRGRATTVGDISVTDSAGNQLNVQNSPSEGSYYTMFLKFASIQWKATQNLTLEAGAVLQNHYITQERFWGLRYVAQTFQDKYWKIPSSDLGFIAYYKINNWLSFDLALTNGEGPRVKQDAQGKVKYAGGITINPTDKFQTRIYFHEKQSTVDSLKNEQMLSAFSGMKVNDKFRLGGEFNYMNNFNHVADVSSYGFSFYSAYRIMKNAEVFARFDRLLFEQNENKETVPELNNRSSLIGGISFTPVKGIHVSLNYQGMMPDAENDMENMLNLSMEYKL